MAKVIKLSERESICCSAPLVHHHTKSPYNSCSKCKQKCGERLIGQQVVTPAGPRGLEAELKALLDTHGADAVLGTLAASLS